MGGIDLFVNLCHLLCGVPHGGWRGLGWRGNAFLSAGFAPWSPDRALGSIPRRALLLHLNYFACLIRNPFFHSQVL